MQDSDGYQPFLVAPENGYRALVREGVKLMETPSGAAVDAVDMVLRDVGQKARRLFTSGTALWFLLSLASRLTCLCGLLGCVARFWNAVCSGVFVSLRAVCSVGATGAFACQRLQFGSVGGAPRMRHYVHELLCFLVAMSYVIKRSSTAGTCTVSHSHALCAAAVT